MRRIAHRAQGRYRNHGERRVESVIGGGRVWRAQVRRPFRSRPTIESGEPVSGEQRIAPGRPREMRWASIRVCGVVAAGVHCLWISSLRLP